MCDEMQGKQQGKDPPQPSSTPGAEQSQPQLWSLGSGTNHSWS